MSIEDIIDINIGYPSPDDENLQSKIYNKREFYFNKIKGRSKLNSQEEINQYRDETCNRKRELFEQQILLKNFINPDTPYRGLLIFHGTGVGKCVLPDTMIQTNYGVQNIKSIWDKYHTNNIHDDLGEWSMPNKKLYVNSLSDNKLKLNPIAKLYRQYINENIRQITLSNKNTISITYSHKLLTMDGWKNNITVNDKIAVANNSVRQIGNISIGNDMALFLAHVYNNCINGNNKSLNKIKGNNLDKIITHAINGFDKNNIKYDEIKIVDDELHIVSNDYDEKIINYENIPNIFMKLIDDEIKLFLNVNEKINNYFIDILKKLITHNNNDIEYMEIINIVEKKYKGYVYDLEIENDHNFIANNIVAHNTCTGITIAEQFKEVTQKYDTKIYVLMPGPVIKETWKNELLTCTGETYMQRNNDTMYVSKENDIKMKNNAINNIYQYYRLLSYKSFYKKVLGEKVVKQLRTSDNKIKKEYKKNAQGEFERDISMDRIYDLNNSLIIIDEAHHLTDNYYGQALLHIIKNSKNLKVILLTATPMQNLADEIVLLLNFIRPLDKPIKRDKIFNKHTNHLMDFKSGGREYLAKMANGYVSYLRGADPLTFALRVEHGEIPPGLQFTKLNRCYMLKSQLEVYNHIINTENDSLSRKSVAAANFIIPGLSSDGKTLKFYYGNEGIETVKNQLKSISMRDTLIKKVAELLKIPPNSPDIPDLMRLSDGGESIAGKILDVKYVKEFSIKFYEALIKINKLVWSDKKKSGTAFVYSNVVRSGIYVFKEILLQNGYLEYNENSKNYKINNNTVCYFCGHTFGEHNNLDKKIPNHTFYPATFLSITGKSTEDDDTTGNTEEKYRILNTVFNNINNVDGKYIKLILGSRVMTEGTSLKNINEIHILDFYFNLGSIDQIIGRGIRYCSHYGLMKMGVENPQVDIYKYVVSDKSKITEEEDLYRKAEEKYKLIKKTERVLKETALDCAFNRKGNIFPEEVEKYKGCTPPGEPPIPGKEVCPAMCDFMECDYKCKDTELNKKYFDKTNNEYIHLSKDQLDYTTFTPKLAENEINNIKDKIKNLYRLKYVYTLHEIMNHIKKIYDKDKKDLFDEFFVFKAINDLLPKNENDFNNFKDTIYDKFNNTGYLINVDKFYVFQPFNLNEDALMYYRSTFNPTTSDKVSLLNYMENTFGYVDDSDTYDDKDNEKYTYDTEYYRNRPEAKFVGIIDRESGKKSSGKELEDVFKIREEKLKETDKKRGTGIQSFTGAVCSTSKTREYLENVSKHLSIKFNKDQNRLSLCHNIMDKLLLLEKYAKGKDKMTFIIVPENHKKYKFPYNLEDRYEHIKNKIKNEIKIKLNIEATSKNVKVDNNTVTNYQIKISDTDKITQYKDFLTQLGFNTSEKIWTIKIE